MLQRQAGRGPSPQDGSGPTSYRGSPYTGGPPPGPAYTGGPPPGPAYTGGPAGPGRPGPYATPKNSSANGGKIVAIVVGVLAVTLLLVGGVAFAAYRFLDDQVSSLSEPSFGEEALFPSGTAFPEPSRYGEDPDLDLLYDACKAGDLDACDDLWLSSAPGSEYETFGDTCGGTTQGAEGLCAFTAEGGGENDADLPQLRTACADGDDVACNDLFLLSAPGSDDEEFGSTCGGRSEPAYGGC